MSSVPQEAQLFHTAPAALALQPPLLPSHAADEDTFVGSQQAHWPPAANGVSPPAIVQQDWDHTQPMPTGDCAPDSAVSRRSRQMLLATRIEAWGRLLQVILAGFCHLLMSFLESDSAAGGLCSSSVFPLSQTRQRSAFVNLLNARTC